MTQETAPYPILFVHAPIGREQFLPEFLFCALAQAKASNPDSPVLLISPTPFRFHTGVEALDRGIYWAPYEAYEEEAKKFRNMYVHLSNNPFEFERFCMERWFVVKAFLKKHRIGRLAYFDSDVLLYSPLSIAAAPFQDVEVASLDGSWGTAIINRASLMDEFCEMLLEIYSRKTKLWEWVIQRIGINEPWPGGEHPFRTNTTDMEFCSLYHRLHPEVRYAELPKVINGGAFDRNINTHDNLFEFDGKMKKIEWRGGVPYVKYLPDGSTVRLHCLHYQGFETKLKIKDAFLAQWDIWKKNLGVPESMTGMPKFLQSIEVLELGKDKSKAGIEEAAASLNVVPDAPAGQAE
jgi:hypothetical protein